MAGYVCSAFIGRCGLKKLKRTLLLFLGFIFSLELLHARCLFPRLETKKKEKGKKKNLNAITHLKVKTNSQKTPRIISQIRYKSSGGENSELQGFFIGGWLPEFVFSRFRLHALSTWRGLGEQFGRPIIM